MANLQTLLDDTALVPPPAENAAWRRFRRHKLAMAGR
jgi:peptide/nickel transport system permease protein